MTTVHTALGAFPIYTNLTQAYAGLNELIAARYGDLATVLDDLELITRSAPIEGSDDTALAIMALPKGRHPDRRDILVVYYVAPSTEALLLSRGADAPKGE